MKGAKIATAGIYRDMVAYGDVCKLVGNKDNYKLYLFYKNEYISIEKENMSFAEASVCLDAIREIVDTVQNNDISVPMVRNFAVQHVIHEAALAFRKGFDAGYEKCKQDDEKRNLLLRVQTFCDTQIQVTRDLKRADAKAKQTLANLNSAAAKASIPVISQTEFEALKAKYEREVQTNGSVPPPRR